MLLQLLVLPSRKVCLFSHLLVLAACVLCSRNCRRNGGGHSLLQGLQTLVDLRVDLILPVNLALSPVSERRIRPTKERHTVGIQLRLRRRCDSLHIVELILEVFNQQEALLLGCFHSCQPVLVLD